MPGLRRPGVARPLGIRYGRRRVGWPPSNGSSGRTPRTRTGNRHRARPRRGRLRAPADRRPFPCRRAARCRPCRRHRHHRRPIARCCSHRRPWNSSAPSVRKRSRRKPR